MYPPINVDGPFKDLSVAPRSSHEDDLHSGILQAMSRQKQSLDDAKLVLRLPEHWRSPIRGWRDGSQLELPQDFLEVLSQGNNDMDAAKIVSKSHRRGQSSSKPEPTSTPERKRCRSVSLPPSSPFNTLQPSPGHLADTSALERAQLVQEIIKKHDLEVTPDDAARLKKFLEVENNQRESYALLRFLMRNPQPQDGVKYVSIGAIKHGDSTLGRGDASLNENAEHPDLLPTGIICRWALFSPLMAKDLLTTNEDKVNETVVERKIGPLLSGIFSTSMGLSENTNKPTPFINPLRLFATTPRPDFVARLTGEQWQDWTYLMLLNLTYGEGKTYRTYAANARRTSAQLAMNGVATLDIFILMYLSTRKYLEDKQPNDQNLPPWMFTMSFVYTEKGFTFYGHYPKFVEQKWRFGSWEMSNRFANVLSNDATRADRMRCLAAFFRICSHTLFVLKQIQAWSKHLPPSVAPLMQTLIARAHFDAKDNLWLREKVEEL